MYQRDPIGKRLFRATYRAYCGAQVFLNALLLRQPYVAVSYGGARKGDIGGPLVKVKRLREYFPERRWSYSLVYLLSNAQYLPGVALRMLKRRHVPIVHNQNGVFYKAWYGGDWQAQNRHMALSYHLADWVFYQSEFCRRSADLFLGPRSGPGEVLYNAVDTARFTPASNRPDGRFVFLITGKIGDHLYYRLESTIAGLELARRDGLDASLVVAGWVEDEARRRAEALAASLGIAGRLVFSGPYTQEQAPRIYQEADAYVMTKHNDPCPNTVLEALAAGLPVLYSNSGGVPELVGDEAGVALPCEQGWDAPHAPTAEDVARGMLRIAGQRASFAVAARQRAVARFDIGHWIERHRALFESLVAERR